MTQSIHSMRYSTFIQFVFLESLVGIVCLPLCCLLQKEGALSGWLDKLVESSNTNKLNRKVVYPRAGSLVFAAKIKVFPDYTPRLEFVESTPEIINLVSHLKWIDFESSLRCNFSVDITSHYSRINRDDLQDCGVQ